MEKNPLFGKCLVVGMVLFFIGAIVIPSNAQKLGEKLTTSISSGDIIYVDDDNIEGPWDGTIDNPYKYIQHGIDAAENGDTVFVFNGIYWLNEIAVDKSISLIGEDKNNTIIDGYFDVSLVRITADAVTMKGFKLLNKDRWSGIIISSNNNILIDNIITDCQAGINIGNVESGNNTIIGNIVESNSIYGIVVRSGCNYNTIKDNILRFNGECGIKLIGSMHHNLICGNRFEDNSIGIEPGYAQQTTICDNIFLNNEYGVKIGEAFDINISRNSFKNSNCGVYLTSGGNTIKSNNFINNVIDATFKYYGSPEKNYWNYNYWNRPKLLPKFIYGKLVISNYESEVEYPWLNFDLRPAFKPYNI